MAFSSGSSFQWPPPGFSTVWFNNYISSPVWQSATVNSIEAASASTIAATVIGTAAAFGLRGLQWRFKGLVELLLLSPLILPTVILAMALFAVLGVLHLLDTLAGLVAGYTVLLLPLVVLNVRAGLYAFDRRLEYAAASLGASPWTTFRRVTLPLVKPNIFAGALLALAMAWDESILAIFLTGEHAGTLPKQMWNGIRSQSDPTIVAVSAILITVSAIAVVVVLIAQPGRGGHRAGPALKAQEER
jgi:putative spermidine/putrescine transport system permease protein